MAVSRIGANTNGGTSAEQRAMQMATRNTMIVPRYGRANATPAAPSLRCSCAHPRRLGVAAAASGADPSAWLRGYAAPRDVYDRALGRAVSACAPRAGDAVVGDLPWSCILAGGGVGSGPVVGDRRRSRRRRRRLHAEPTDSVPADSESATGRRDGDRASAPSRCRSTTPTRRRARFELYLARHLATKPDERIGTLLVNPGGPGFGGSELAVHADQIYGQTLLDHFDIVGWDPRGTGASEPAIDCIDDYDHFFAGADITPDDEAERQQLVDLAKEFADDCVDKNADILQYVGTNNSARDMDAIRRALGEDTISYFGFSYGSELGATWATMFPDTVRAAVLDGAVDPTADATRE